MRKFNSKKVIGISFVIIFILSMIIKNYNDDKNDKRLQLEYENLRDVPS